MANTDAPAGLRPLRGNGGGSPKLKDYNAGTSTDIFRGDIVAIATNGRIHTIGTATGTVKVIGVAANHIDASDSSSAQIVWVYDDPHQEFVLQDDGDTGTPDAASVGATAEVVITTGNTTTGQSKQELDISALGVAATDPLIIKGFVTGPGRSIADFADIIVQLNQHIYKQASAGT